jgi:hypothetical protein
MAPESTVLLSFGPRGTSPHPLLNQLDIPKERNSIKVNAAMGMEGHPGVWALGDCAMIPDEQGGYHAPTDNNGPYAASRMDLANACIGQLGTDDGDQD